MPHHLYKTTIDDASVGSAIISVTLPGEDSSRIIDYLMTLYGLDRDKIENSALVVPVGGVNLRVINPIVLMQSKIFNLGLRSKQNNEGLAQARVSIDIVRAFVTEALKNNRIEPRNVLDMIRHIVKFSMSKPAIYVFKTYSIDTLKAVPVDALKESSDKSIKNFIQIGFRYDVGHVERSRDKRVSMERLIEWRKKRSDHDGVEEVSRNIKLTGNKPR